VAALLGRPIYDPARGRRNLEECGHRIGSHGRRPSRLRGARRGAWLFLSAASLARGDAFWEPCGGLAATNSSALSKLGRARHRARAPACGAVPGSLPGGGLCYFAG
jgi:hypothetical protein